MIFAKPLIYMVPPVTYLTLDDALNMYMKKFNLEEEPMLPMGSAEEAIDMLMVAIDTNEKLVFDWTDLGPDEYCL